MLDLNETTEHKLLILLSVRGRRWSKLMGFDLRAFAGASELLGKTGRSRGDRGSAKKDTKCDFGS
jgi:hypothetical protein